MTGRPGHWRMAMNGGSSAPYLACTPWVPCFVLCLMRVETEGLLDYQGRGSFPLCRGTLAWSYSVSEKQPKIDPNLALRRGVVGGQSGHNTSTKKSTIRAKVITHTTFIVGESILQLHTHQLHNFNCRGINLCNARVALVSACLASMISQKGNYTTTMLVELISNYTHTSYTSIISGKEKTHKHKQICGIVPGLGGCQKFVYVFFFRVIPYGREKTHKQNYPQNPGTIP